MKFPLDFTALHQIADIAREIPSLRIVINHCGGAVGPTYFNARPGNRAAWEQALGSLARHPNVFMRISGLQMEFNGYPLGRDSHPDRPASSDEIARLTYPVYSYCLKMFGADRCLAASNFPPDQWGTTYANLWNALKKVAHRAGLSD